MRTLITGADGSLGTRLCERWIWPTLAMGRSIDTMERITEFLEANKSTVQCLECVVLNDGTNHLSWIGTTNMADAEILHRNVMLPYWTLNELVRIRGVDKPMRVIFVTSQTYRVPQRTTALYCASKAALTMIMKVAARELAPWGWVINAVAPGKITDTKMSVMTDEQVEELRGWTQDEADQYALKMIPAKRYTNREEVVKTILHVASLPPYVNGTIIEVMGGV